MHGAPHLPTGGLVRPYLPRGRARQSDDRGVYAELHLDLARDASAGELAAFAPRCAARACRAARQAHVGELDAAPALAARAAQFAAMCGIADAPALLAEHALAASRRATPRARHADRTLGAADNRPPPDELTSASARRCPTMERFGRRRVSRMVSVMVAPRLGRPACGSARGRDGGRRLARRGCAGVAIASAAIRGSRADAGARMRPPTPARLRPSRPTRCTRSFRRPATTTTRATARTPR